MYTESECHVQNEPCKSVIEVTMTWLIGIEIQDKREI